MESYPVFGTRLSTLLIFGTYLGGEIFHALQPQVDNTASFVFKQFLVGGYQSHSGVKI